MDPANPSNSNVIDPMTHPISPGNTGIQELRRTVGEIRTILPGELDKSCPIVLVPGFSGWSQPFLGTVNYFGGFEDLPLILSNAGYIVIVVRIGPLSTNRERACEVFAQLRKINSSASGRKGLPRGYDLPGTSPATLIPVDYGTTNSSPHQNLVAAAQIWQAVVYASDSNPLPGTWKWSDTNKVNFICHSQGGTTIRYLIELLSGSKGPDLPQFEGTDRQDWVKSVVTLGSPHKGTTITSVVNDFLPLDGLDPLIDFVTSCSFNPRSERIYDLCLDHWEFSRRPDETYQAMRDRIAPDVRTWWTGRSNGLNDNSLRGAEALETFAPTASNQIYYFTMSFCATQPFPQANLTPQDINEFLDMFHFHQVWNPFGLLGHFFSPVQAFLSWVTVLPALYATLTWLTDVANRHLAQLGYFSQIPRPGSQIPRSDILPLMAFPAYSMAGRRIDENAYPRIPSGEFQPNDGIVNTRSMDGPVAGPVDNGFFPTALRAPGNTVKGKYWHLGKNSTIDHADEIGVFTDRRTNAEIQVMYLLFAELGARIR
ncbi:hypothetical protein PV08_02537 [Exophiala spinifera]|uniref:Lipase-like C-terminal domain-containing protein n=1 Tax=Exophiala spinifera TaxID=91928 RepID=A0A0D2C3N1_9EURO|nr:uncharacterized protein PV08_02537 [Exophiala spinifera]KIW18249.1 hypothetical protein PV08_02537 [Exophiala spinifera]